MSMGNAAETALLTLLFTNIDWANVGDAAGLLGSTADGSFYISLHTGDPGEAGSQTTSEADYTSYARVAVARDNTKWTVAGNQVSNAALITFPTATGGSNTCTYFAVGRDTAGAGMIIVSAALTAQLIVSSGITPEYAIGALVATAD